ncbi:MAG: LysR family transcriptional regulator [Actinomycetota bacterium]
MATPLPDVSVRQWEYLVAVAESPTWASAAAEVGVSTSALSQGLAELERRLGVPVFERDGRRKVLAPHARPVLDHARRVLALSGDLTDWVARTRDGSTGRVRVGMIDVAALVHLAEPLRRFRIERADVDLRLVVAPSSELLDQLRRGDLDLAVGVRDDGPEGDLDAVDLLTEALAIYGPPGAVAGTPATWGPWVLFPTGSRTRSLIEAELRRRGAAVDVVAESNQPEVLGEMVRLSIGWTVLPEAQATGGPEPLRRLVDEPLVHRHLALHRRAGAVVAPVVDELAHAVQRPVTTA